MNVGQDTSRGNRHATKELIEFFIVLDSERNVARHNSALLVIASGITGEFQDFSAKVLKHGRKVHRSTGTHTSGVLALSQITADTTDGELQTSFRRSGGGLMD